MHVKRDIQFFLFREGYGIRHAFTSLIFIVVFFFFSAGMIVSVQSHVQMSSSSVNQATRSVSTDFLMKLLANENRHLVSQSEKENWDVSISRLLFQVATSMTPSDPRSFIGNEIPLFRTFDSKIIVAGEGTNITNLPVESVPKAETLQEGSQAKEEAIEEGQVKKEKPQPPMTTGGTKRVYIYHTHSRESFFPLLKQGATDPFDAKANITLVGEKLGKALEERGIGTKFDKTDFTGIILERQKTDKNMSYAKSYKVSREGIVEAFKTTKTLDYAIDIHRDALAKKYTTVKINGKDYARVIFIVGSENPNYEKNIAIAKELDQRLKKKYPGLSRGVISKGGPGNNGVYNQDVTGNALLLEVGGVDTNMKEIDATVEAFADVFSEFFWQAEKVNGQ